MKHFSLLRLASATLLILFTMVPQISFAASEVTAANTLDENIDSIIKTWCGYYDENNQPQVVSIGSGIVLGENLILTPAHTVFYLDTTDSNGTFYYYDFCWGGAIQNSYVQPEPTFNLDYIGYDWDSEFDYAFMSATDSSGLDWQFSSELSYGNPDSLVYGDDLTLIGFPMEGVPAISSVSGIVSGFISPTWIKTDAVSDYEDWGGGAFDSLGNFIGMPTFNSSDPSNPTAYIQNINAILEDALGYGFIMRDYEHLYDVDNIVCFESGECYNFGEGEVLSFDEGAIEESPVQAEDPVDVVPEVSSEPEPVVSLGSEIEEGKYEEAKRDQKLIDRMTGSILLQVELHGEAWYVNPEDKLRYYMRDGAVAYEMMRSFGLGITDKDLEAIPAVESTDEMKSATSVCSTNALANRLKGQILLQVEQHGEAWWVSPTTCRRIYMKDGAAAYEIMRFLSVGITNEDLSKMPTGDIQ